MPIAPLASDPDFGALANRLRVLREQKGMTYEQLAEASGLSRRGVISLERGERSGNVRSWYRVARALGVDFSVLMAVLDEPTP